MRLTPYGKHVRKLRIDSDTTLAQMAEFQGVTSSYLSSVETGRRPITDQVVRKAIEFFRLYGIEAPELRALADQSQKAVSVSHLLEGERETVFMLARRFPQKGAIDREQFLKRLQQFIKEEN